MTDPSSSSPPTIDAVAAARWQRNAPAQSPWLHEEVARRMQERLGWIKAEPGSWCHWEAVRGGLLAHELVRQRYPLAQVWVQESSPQRAAAAVQALQPPWWRPARWRGGSLRVQAPAAGTVQMLWANMALHQSVQPQELLAQWHSALAVDGFLMFSCLGPDTVRELGDLYRRLGWPVCGHEFTDMHDWGDMLLQAGFAEPVMDMERIVLTYEDAPALLRDLRSLGRNLHPARFAALRGRAWQRELEAELGASLARPEHDGRLALTFEIVYGHAFKPEPRMTVRAESTVSLEQMRSALARPTPPPRRQ